MSANSAFSDGAREPRVHVRLVWPFLSAYRSSLGSPGTHGPRSSLDELLGSEGLSLGACVRHDGLVSLRRARRVLARYVTTSGDAAVGLRVGIQVEAGDFHVVEQAARCAIDLRAAVECATRFAPLLSEAAELDLVDAGDSMHWRFQANDGAADPPATEDFVVASATRTVRRYAGEEAAPHEVHLTRAEPVDPGLYARTLGTRVRFAMPYSALVFGREQMDLPLALANPELHAALKAYADELLGARPVGVRGQVAELASQELASGALSMAALARKVGASPATLRRRLEREGTSFRVIVRDLRQSLARQYLVDSRLSVGEIATAVGFSNVRAFHKAFCSWNGVSPSAYRARQRVR